MTDQRTEPGDVRRLSLTITTILGVVGDPTTLVFVMNAPSGTVTTHTWQTDTALVKESAGVFHVDWPVAQVGTHRYSWVSSGVNAAYAEDSFISVARRVSAA